MNTDEVYAERLDACRQLGYSFSDAHDEAIKEVARRTLTPHDTPSVPSYG